MDYELQLFDRINVIKDVNKKYNLYDNAYIAFSGGKDSTVLSHLIDEALPGNKIPRVYVNTGIEFVEMVKHVKKLAESDDRIIIIKPTIPFKQSLEEHGYPFKSKDFANKVSIYQRHGMMPGLERWLSFTTGIIKCPDKLRYLFESQDAVNFKISDKCCVIHKELPMINWAKENNKSIAIIGIMQAEGGRRGNHKTSGCFINYGKKYNFYPLKVVSKEWEEEYIKQNNIGLCPLYYPPYNFERTGCKGCPFSIRLQKDLDSMPENERKQCEYIWNPVYEEYRRIKYRLK